MCNTEPVGAQDRQQIFLGALMIVLGYLAEAGCSETGHEWSTDGQGARPCPRGHDHCSQPVYVCIRCGEIDYGEPGGPGDRDCKENPGCRED